MSDQSPFPAADPNESPNITQMREAYEASQAARKAAEDQLAAAAVSAKENAFLRAGVDLDSPLGKLMFNGYDGEVEVDKIKEFAEGIGPASAPAAPVVTDAEREQQRLREGLVGDAPPPPAADEADPWKEGFDRFHERLGNGASRENAAAEVFDRVITAAVAKDERVLYDPQRFREEFSTP